MPRHDYWKRGRVVFLVITVASWIFFYLFVPAVIFFMVASFTPFYCMVNAEFQDKVGEDCWGF